MQKRNKFDTESLIKISKGAGIAGGAVAILYVFEWLITCDFGQWTALIVGILSVVINVVREWRKGKISE